MTLKEIREIQQNFDIRHEGNYPFFETLSGENVEPLEHLIVCLAGELGEFANIVKKVRRGDFVLASVKTDLTDELTDIFIYLIKMANQLDVDLEPKFLERLEANEDRFRKYERR